MAIIFQNIEAVLHSVSKNILLISYALSKLASDEQYKFTGYLILII